MDAEQAYLFRHALYRDAAYQLQLPGDRARLHALAFKLLETVFAADGIETAPLELADHASKAALQPDTDAIEYWQRKELECLRRAAKFAKSRSLEMAETVLRRVIAHPLCDMESKLEGIFEVSQLNVELGNHAQARQSLALAQELAQGSEEQLWRVKRSLAWLDHLEGKTQEAEADLRALMADAQRRGDTRQYADALATQGALLRVLGKLTESERALRQAIDLLRSCHDEKQVTISIGNLSGLLRATDRAAEALDLVDNRLIEELPRGRPQSLEWLQTQRARALLELGRMREAHETALVALELAKSVGMRAREVRIRNVLGYLLSRMGRSAEVLQTLEEVCAVSRETGDVFTLIHALGNLGVTYERYDELAKAELALRQSRELAARFQMNEARDQAALNLAGVLAKRAALDEAESLLQAILANEGSPSYRTAQIMLAKVWIKRGALAEAENLLEQVRAKTELKGFQLVAFEAAMSMLRLRQGRTEEAYALRQSVINQLTAVNDLLHVERFKEEFDRARTG
ncbi:MAG: hypothetical protein HUU03_06875 [Planctomycetaceae bacterium]|nr:hypothetical protein [Planctomycetaceae bacterium]